MSARRLPADALQALTARLLALLDAQDEDAERVALLSVHLGARVLLDQHYPVVEDLLDANLRPSVRPVHRGPRAPAGQPSRRQLDVLREIVRRQGEGVSPTYQEIGEALGIHAANGVADHVEALVEKGLLQRRKPGTARCLTPTERGRALVQEAA